MFNVRARKICSNQKIDVDGPGQSAWGGHHGTRHYTARLSTDLDARFAVGFQLSAARQQRLALGVHFAKLPALDLDQPWDS